MLRSLPALIALLALTIPLSRAAEPAAEPVPVPGRWTPERVSAWYDGQPWPCGFNYVPANAISYTEMWMAPTFDPVLIDRELALAQDTGFNCLRVVLPFVVWEAEPDAFKNRLRQFLGICEKRGLRVMLAPFDDCVFGPITDPVFGPQPDVVPGWYANGWTPSPGHKMVRDSNTWPRLERYVTDLLTTFGRDARVWVWDIYNEPTNGPGNDTLPLLTNVVRWSRAAAPAQPLTIGVWNSNAALNDIALRESDVITFHHYGPADDLEQQIIRLRKRNRPVICTEWLNRGRGSLVATCLPVFQKYRVGCLHWGLVNGRTQTHLGWGHRPGQPEPQAWQHDLYRPDLTPYDPAELQLFRTAIRAAK